MAAIPQVAVLIETSREYARGLLRGVARYHHQHGPWSIYFEPHGLNAPPPKWLRSWKGDGILVRIDDQRMAQAISETTIPAVDVRGAFPALGLPFIGIDNRPVTQLAYDHLKACGLKNFAFCGTPRGLNPNQDWRCDLFVELARNDGRECPVFLPPVCDGGHRNWDQNQQHIVAWLRHLPKPVGIMSCNDDRGREVLDACRRANLRVPDEVAVIGVDNDPHLCNLCTPPLSSVDVNPDRIGYEAAKLLHALMRGERAPEQPQLLGPPRGIAARQSTDTLYVDDVDVAEAIRFVRNHAIDGISVKDVVHHSRRSQSTLERRVKKALGRTIQGELTRVRISRAKSLLYDTELTIADIAAQSGFREAKYFSEVFRQHEGMTATDFRRNCRAGHS